MTQNTIINALPRVQMTNLIAQLEVEQKAQLDAIDARLPARFSSVAIRQSTYAAFTSQGGVMVDGMMCTVGGRPMYFQGGFWRGVVREAPVYVPATRQLPLTRNDDVEDSFAEAAVADPGYPYRLWVEADTYLFAADCEAEVRVRAGNGAADGELGIVTTARNVRNNTTGLQVSPQWRATGTLTGPSRVIGYVKRLSAGGSWAITTGSLFYQVEPA